MNENNQNFQNEDYSLKDDDKFQYNNYDKDHYISTCGPTEPKPGNTTSLVVLCFFMTVAFFAFGLFLLFSDINVTSSVTDSLITNKIVSFIIMFIISLFFLVCGFHNLKLAKKYYKQKRELENEPIDETVEDKIWQRTCPKCGELHDIDYPKCPNCKFNYFE